MLKSRVLFFLTLFLLPGIPLAAPSVLVQVEEIAKVDGIYALDVKVRDHIAYVAIDQGGVQMYDVRNPAVPSLLGVLPTSLPIRALEVTSDHMYALNLQDVPIANTTQYTTVVTLDIFDRSVSSAPKLIGSFHPTDQSTLAMAVDEPFVYLVGRAGLAVYDTSDASVPALISQLAVENSDKVRVADGIVYVSTAFHKINIIDVHTKVAPRLLHELERSLGQSGDLQVEGSRVYISAYRRLYIGHGEFANIVTLDMIDVSDLTNPRSWTVFLDGYYPELFVKSGLLFVNGTIRQVGAVGETPGIVGVGTWMNDSWVPRAVDGPYVYTPTNKGLIIGYMKTTELPYATYLPSITQSE